MLYNVIATCRNENCESNGFENCFESEEPESMAVICGPCQNIIEDITATPKE